MRTQNPFEFVLRTFRNSPWVMISISVHVIAIAILAVWYIAKPSGGYTDDAPIVLTRSATKVEEADVVIPPVEITQRNIIPALDEGVLVSEPLDYFDPVPMDAPPDPEAKLGDPTGELEVTTGVDASTSTGVGPNGHKGNGPSPFRFREGPLGPSGRRRGDEKYPWKLTDALVLDGLRWLARHQNADGSWTAAGVRQHCSSDATCSDPKQTWTSNYDEGLTGMALLAYLGAGYSHESKQWIVDPITHQRWRVGDIVKNGLRWLKNRQNQDGSFSRDRAFLYNEALATLALTEAYGLTQNRYWQEPAQRGIDFLVRAQRPNPSGQGAWGWRYASRQDIEAKYPGGSLDETGKRELFDSDLSATGWCVMALKSAQLSKLTVDPNAMEGALAFARFVSLPDGQAGYLDAKGAGQKVSGIDDHFEYHAASMSALSMCVRTFTAHDAADPFLEPAARRVVADLPRTGKDGLEADYYYWYYGSIALHQFDGPDSPRSSGKYWGPWNKAMVEALTTTQTHDPKSCRDGGWLRPDRWCHSGGPIYATAINVLTAEVYYRYENAFGGRRH